jgi:hypothetical protein
MNAEKPHAIKWPEDLLPDSRCPLGKHKGKEMKDVPVDYLKWVYDEFTTNNSNRSQDFWLVARYYRKHYLTKKKY